MMLTKPKEEEEGTDDSTTNNTELLLPPPPPASLLQQTTTNDLEKELERRLSMLGKNDDESKATAATATAANKEVDVVVEVKSSHNNEGDLISFDEPPQKLVVAPVAPTVPSVTTPFVAPAVQEIQAKKPAPAPSKPNKSALLVSTSEK